MRGNKLRLLFLNPARSFADDLDIADNGSLGLMVAFQRRRVINPVDPLNIASEAVNGFRDVLSNNLRRARDVS